MEENNQDPNQINIELSEEVADVERRLKQNLTMFSLQNHETLKAHITDGVKQIKQNII